MPDEIRPALSAEEWARERVESTTNADTVSLIRSEHGRVNFVAHGTNGWRGEPNTIGLVMGTRMPLAIMALANAALSDDSPHKITRADVDMLESSAENDHDAYVNRGAMNQLAAKLAALLPPEKPDAA